MKGRASGFTAYTTAGAIKIAQQSGSILVPGPPGMDGSDGDSGIWIPPGIARPAQLYSRAFDNAGITFTNNVTRSVPLDTKVFDSGGIHSTVTNNTRFTVPSGGAGVYVISGQIAFLTAAAGRFIVTIEKNGSASLGNMDVQLPAASVQQQIAAPTVIDVAIDGDYYELLGYQLTGGNIGDNTGNSSTWMAIARLN